MIGPGHEHFAIGFQYRDKFGGGGGEFSVRNEGVRGVNPPHNCTGPWHLCFSRGPRVGP